MKYLLLLLMLFQPPEGKQLASIFESNARLNLWHGSVRSGKTIGSMFRWLDFVNNAPPGDLLMTGKTLTTLKRNILRPLSDLTGEDYFAGISKKEIQMLGRRVYVEGANDESAVGKIQGMTLAGHYGDEVSLWPESYWQMGLSRLSVKDAKFFGTTNPDNPHHYLKTDVLDRTEELDLTDFHFVLDDNPFLDPVFVDALKREYTGLWHLRYVQGLWVVAEGAIYDMFDADVHVVDPGEIPEKIVRYWIGCDYGTTNPTVFLLLGQDKTGMLYVIDEYRWDSKEQGRQKTDSEYSRDFQKWNGKIRYSNVFVPPDATSFALQMHRDGIPRIATPDNTVIDGIRNVATVFSNDLIRISKKCPGLIRELQGYMWDAKAQETGIDKPIKQDDHGPDALRYIIRMIRQYWQPYLGRRAA